VSKGKPTFAAEHDSVQRLTRFGQTITSQTGESEFTSASLEDWSVPGRSLLNPHRLFASKQLLVEED